MKRAVLLILGALLAVPAVAQVSYDTVTATVRDPDGQALAGARYSMRLVDAVGQPVSSASTPDGEMFNAKPVFGNLDASGSFSVGLVPNTILTKPSGTRWLISIESPLPPEQSQILTYEAPWSINYYATITASVDLSAQLSGLASNVTYANLQSGQATFAGWLTGTADPPTLPCGAGAHEGYFYLSSAGNEYQCTNAIGGVYTWHELAGASPGSGCTTISEGGHCVSDNPTAGTTQFIVQQNNTELGFSDPTFKQRFDFQLPTTSGTGGYADFQFVDGSTFKTDPTASIIVGAGPSAGFNGSMGASIQTWPMGANAPSSATNWGDGLFIGSEYIDEDYLQNQAIKLYSYNGGFVNIIAASSATTPANGINIFGNLGFNVPGGSFNNYTSTHTMTWAESGGGVFHSVDATTASFTVTLPPAAGPGGNAAELLIFWKSTAANMVTIAPGVGDTISGTASNPTLSALGSTLEFVSDGFNKWYEVGQSGSGAGVTKIIAGTNVTVSPADGTGAVTINASGGGTGYAVANTFTFTGAGSQSFTHNLGIPAPYLPAYNCATLSGAQWQPNWMTWTDANTVTMTAPAATVTACTFGQSGNVLSLSNPAACPYTGASGTAQNCTTTPNITVGANSCIAYSTTTSNSGTALTLAVNGGSPSPVAVRVGTSWTTTLAPGYVPAGSSMLVCYSGSVWDVQSPASSVSSTVQKIQTITASASPTQMDFTSIPSTYTSLQVNCVGQSQKTAFADTWEVKFNGDATAGHYGWAYYNYGRTNTEGFSTGAAMYGGDAGVEVSGAAIPTLLTINLPSYANTTWDKMATIASQRSNSTDASQQIAYTIQGLWLSTAAINEVTIFFSSGSAFTNGSSCTLYGTL